MKADKKRKKSLWKIDIELREQSLEEQDQREREQSQSLENVVILDDDTVPANTNDTTGSSNIKQVTFNTSSTVQDTFYTTSTVQDSSASSPEAIVPPKKSSRVVWQDHVEVME